MIYLLKNLRIQTKLLFMPLVAMAAFLAILATYTTLEEREDELNARVEQEYYPYHQITIKLEDLFTELQSSLQHAVVKKDSDLLDEIEAKYSLIRVQLQNAERLGTANGDRLVALQPDIERYFFELRNTAEKMIAGASDDVLLTEVNQIVKDYNALQAMLLRETREAEATISQAFLQQRQNHKIAMTVTSVAALLSISLLGGLSLILTRLLTTPLKHLVKAVDRFAQNEENVAIEIRSSDEIGELAAAFKDMIAKIQTAKSEKEKAYQEVLHAKETIERQVKQLSAANAELDKHRHHLEELVEERAEELHKANIKLKDEIAMRARSEVMLKSYNKKLESQNRELQDFAYIASHDLQEPLRKIQAFGDRLKNKYGELLSEQGRDYLERMQNAAGRMQRLIEDLLTYSRVTTKAQPFTNVNLAQIAREVISDLEIQIAEKKGLIEIENLPVVEADPTQIRQLVQNLVANSLKFHRDDAPPVIKIYSDFAGDRNGETQKVCKITVEDNGIGFEEKYAERIFGVFQRLHGREKYEGSGIGLAVCRKIVERHGGEITASGAPGRGAKFEITLPINQKGD
jgi:signal transduction histidine kinase/HAMP domain-containing protein